MRVFAILLGLSLFHLTALSDALAATKEMQCERYLIDEKGVKDERFIFQLSANFDREAVEVKLIKQPEQKKTGEFPITPGTDWKIVWHSDDSLRVVALNTRHNSENPFFSPVMMLDIDFANVRMAHYEAGGLIDFSPVVNDPWKTECSRLD